MRTVFFTLSLILAILLLLPYFGYDVWGALAGKRDGNLQEVPALNAPEIDHSPATESGPQNTHAPASLEEIEDLLNK
ncbi:MAG: hypothetical protein J5J00_15140 [Deltaproteobacteria bacterium]|nr:hypothetical protein [Deltaproteobacteria bacterium]